MIKKIVLSIVLAFSVVAFGSAAYAAADNASLSGSEAVTIPDAKLESVVRATLKKQNGSITVSDMEQLTVLDANYLNIKNLQGLEYAKKLKSLKLKYNEITDLTPISNLTSLETLAFGLNKTLTVFPSLPKLSNLTSLDFEESQFSDISNLKDLPNLSSLTISDNRISDFSPLSNLSKLKTLWATNVNMTDLSPLAGATSLEYLYLGTFPYHSNMNEISDLSPLKNLKNLIELSVHDNNVTDLSILEQLSPRLNYIDLNSNQITDIAPLYNFYLKGGLKGKTIDIRGNPLNVYAGSKAWDQLMYMKDHGGSTIDFKSYSTSTPPKASDITVYNNGFVVIKNVRKGIRRIYVEREIYPNFFDTVGYADVTPNATVIQIPLDLGPIDPGGGKVYVSVEDFIMRASYEVGVSYDPLTAADNLPPVTKYQVQPVYETSSKGERYIKASTITLTASDSSGIQSTKYRINGGNWTSYTEPFTILAKDTLKVEYMSTDSNGNIEDINVMDFDRGTFVGAGRAD
ncbi:leucine-rich repeat domain-containing protein [Paenibacillus sp. SI8]|uniref:leucine-rich repeat domain-containing protein n=1 Tax=unclassified Paenibacillus TaxID=185978 RepID=UPI003464F3D7